MRYFLGSTLKSNHIRRCSENSGLPTVGMILANRHFHAAHADLARDHINELRCTDTLLTHREAPQVQSAPASDKAWKFSTINEKIWLLAELPQRARSRFEDTRTSPPWCASLPLLCPLGEPIIFLGRTQKTPFLTEVAPRLICFGPRLFGADPPVIRLFQEASVHGGAMPRPDNQIVTRVKCTF